MLRPKTHRQQIAERRAQDTAPAADHVDRHGEMAEFADELAVEPEEEEKKKKGRGEKYPKYQKVSTSIRWTEVIGRVIRCVTE
jgi:hypothetical protein